MHFTRPQAATVLAALHAYQLAGMGEPSNRTDEIHEIATDNGEVSSLDDAGIDELCRQLRDGLSATPEHGDSLHAVLELLDAVTADYGSEDALGQAELMLERMIDARAVHSSTHGIAAVMKAAEDRLFAAVPNADEVFALAEARVAVTHILDAAKALDADACPQLSTALTRGHGLTVASSLPVPVHPDTPS